MGLIKSIRKIGQKAGGLLRKAAPFLGFIPGVGAVAGGALGALGSIAEGHRGWSGTLGSAAMGGLSGLGGSKLRALLKKGSASAVGGAVAKNAPKVIGIGPGGVPMIDQTGQMGSSILDKLGPLGGFAKGLLPKDADGSVNWGSVLGNAAKYGLPALGAVQASRTQGKADAYRDKAIKLAEAEYAAKAPLRTMGMAGLTDPRLASVNELFNQPRPTFRRY